MLALFSKATLIVCAASLLAACPQREVSKLQPLPAAEQKKLIPVEINRDLDILFVIDNSGSMAQEQTSLANNFPKFIEVLETIEGGLPNVHIGVVSTNIGANTAIDGCEQPNGDNGDLQATPQIGMCAPPAPDPFIINIEDGAMAGGRIVNYPMDKTLAETFSCIAKLGTNGCGFEGPLEAMMRALNNNPNNVGFLRENAFLAVIFIGDEDDCSWSDRALFDQSAVATLGPLTSFRCFEYGVTCNEDDRDVRGLRADCTSRTDSPFLYSLDRYVDFLKGLKNDPGLVIVAAIHGVSQSSSLPEPVSVGDDPMMPGPPAAPILEPACSSPSSGTAVPSIRIAEFLKNFPSRNTITTICQDDLSPGIQQIAELLKRVVGSPCLEGDLKLYNNNPDDSPAEQANHPDGEPFCTVEQVRTPLDGSAEVRELVNKCASEASSVSQAPCWYVKVDAVNCSSQPTRLALTVERNGATPALPTQTQIEARCEVKAPPPPEE